MAQLAGARPGARHVDAASATGTPVALRPLFDAPAACGTVGMFMQVQRIFVIVAASLPVSTLEAVYLGYIIFSELQSSGQYHAAELRGRAFARHAVLQLWWHLLALRLARTGRRGCRQGCCCRATSSSAPLRDGVLCALLVPQHCSCPCAIARSWRSRSRCRHFVHRLSCTCSPIAPVGWACARMVVRLQAGVQH